MATMASIQNNADYDDMMEYSDFGEALPDNGFVQSQPAPKKTTPDSNATFEDKPDKDMNLIEAGLNNYLDTAETSDATLSEKAQADKPDSSESVFDDVDAAAETPNEDAEQNHDKPTDNEGDEPADDAGFDVQSLRQRILEGRNSSADVDTQDLDALDTLHADNAANIDQIQELQNQDDQKDEDENDLEKKKTVQQGGTGTGGIAALAGLGSLIVGSTLGIGTSIAKGVGTLHMNALETGRKAWDNRCVQMMDDAAIELASASKNMGGEWARFSDNVAQTAKEKGLSTKDVYEAMSDQDSKLGQDPYIKSLANSWDDLNKEGTPSKEAMDNYSKAMKKYHSSVSTAITASETHQDGDALSRINDKHREVLERHSKTVNAPVKNAAGEAEDADEGMKKLAKKLSDAINRIMNNIKQAFGMR